MAGRDQRGAAGAARRDDAGDVALSAQPVDKGIRHRRHRCAAVGAEHADPPRAVVQRDFLRGDVAGGSLAAGGDVDQAGAQAAACDDVADEAQLCALGVERADDQHDRWSGASASRAGSRRGRATSSSRVTPVVTVRAAASMRAIGTGCDQRVGSVGIGDDRSAPAPCCAAGCGAVAGFRPCRTVSMSDVRDRRGARRRAGAAAGRGRRQGARSSRMWFMWSLNDDGDVLGDCGRHVDIFCSIMSTDTSPSSPRRTSIPSTWATMTGANPSVGPSMISKCGLVRSAREIASICRSPPES